jgi:hypothetical protein
MNGIRFYLEHNTPKDKRQNNHSGNVIAVLHENYIVTHDDIVYDAIGAIFYHANSAVCGTQCSQLYLTEKCKRISEEKARSIHPMLFQYLD